MHYKGIHDPCFFNTAAPAPKPKPEVKITADVKTANEAFGHAMDAMLLWADKVFMVSGDFMDTPSRSFPKFDAAKCRFPKVEIKDPSKVLSETDAWVWPKEPELALFDEVAGTLVAQVNLTAMDYIKQQEERRARLQIPALDELHRQLQQEVERVCGMPPVRSGKSDFGPDVKLTNLKERTANGMSLVLNIDTGITAAKLADKPAEQSPPKLMPEALRHQDDRPRGDDCMAAVRDFCKSFR